MLPECGFVTSYKQLNGSQACAGLIMFSFTVKLVLNFAHGVRGPLHKAIAQATMPPGLPLPTACGRPLHFHAVLPRKK